MFFPSALKKGGLYRRAYPSPSHNKYKVTADWAVYHWYIFVMTIACVSFPRITNAGAIYARWNTWSVSVIWRTNPMTRGGSNFELRTSYKSGPIWVTKKSARMSTSTSPRCASRLPPGRDENKCESGSNHNSLHAGFYQIIFYAWKVSFWRYICQPIKSYVRNWSWGDWGVYNALFS